jgi:hypothetical protein
MTRRILAIAILFVLSSAGSASAATSLTIGADDASIRFGATVRLAGSAGPAGTSETVVLESRAAGGAWTRVGATATNAATGAWEYVAKPRGSTSFRVRTTDGLVASDAAAVAVAPNLKLAVVGTPRPFVGADVSARVFPSSYSGWLVLQSTTTAGRTFTKVWVRNGRARVVVPTNAVGRARITGRTRATSSFDRTTTQVIAKVNGRTMRIGDRGADVTGLMKRLRQLGFLTPRDGNRFTFASGEVALAFHKAYGMERTYVWGQRDWQRLSRLKHGPKPRIRTSRDHVEVDKQRQIMMVVSGGKPISIIHVSTGATGNTPVGRFRIYQRGGSYLLNFQAFIGNYGLHGYPSVPAYPASHGCVRQPNWASRFTWDHTRIGTPVYIY